MFGSTSPRPPCLGSCLTLLAVLTALSAFAPTARAADAPKGDSKESADEPKVTLHVGDPAPKLQVGKWIKGGPVDKFEKGKIYIIECWATWCGPCIQSIPHVTELQKKYKDKGVTVIGMNVWENDPAATEPFVKEMGEKMGYAVATDDTAGGDPSHGKMATTWLAAAGRNGIPCSFIVDRDGKLAWIGHPMAMERPLGLIVEGKFDAKKEAEAEARASGLEQEINKAMVARNYDKALGLLDEMAQLQPGMAAEAGLMKLSVLVRKGDYAAANQLAAKLADGAFKDDPRMQGQAALVLLTSGQPEKADADLALKLAEKAYAANPDDLATQKATALAYAAKNQYAKAAEIQGKLVEKLKGGLRGSEEKVLEEYKAKAAGK